MLHQRHDDIVGVKSVRSSIRPVLCYSMPGTATSAGQKSNSHRWPGRAASNIVSFPHAPEPTGCVHTRAGPMFITPPLALLSSCRQWSRPKTLRGDCEDVSGLCMNPHSHFFFRHRCPLFWLHYPGSKAQSGQCSCHLDFTASGAPPLLSGRIILEKPHARGTHLRLCGETALTDGPGLLVP